VTTQERQAVLAASPVRGKYDPLADRESAYEKLKTRAEQATQAAAVVNPAPTEAAPQGRGLLDGLLGGLGGTTSPRGRSRQGMGEALAKSVVRSVGSQVGTRLARGILGALLKR
jgi:hypothetical protein